ncbi:CLUMA_CG009850, isoform A [Clunio marinus]|uniref:Alkaline phosphatase n=1 Tax=Clunio marinus TaxID=568069 RepID=A0A1J1I9M0_9DIPT|nr:CLUMA_CG009850, isoform A [Clunio marinus]
MHNFKEKIKKFLLLIVLILLQGILVESYVWRSPNNDDQAFWRENAERYLSKILKSQDIKGVDKAKNVILFIGDGMSFATIAAGRVLKGQMEKRSGEEAELVFESFPHIGMAKTYNTDKQVPDSAGTATALFTGVKTIIGAIGLNPASDESTANDRMKGIIDWAQAMKKRTGIVTTTRITHATPAATYAYAAKRNYECDTNVPEFMRSYYKDIARQLVEDYPGKGMNVIFGGGRDFLGASKKQESKFKFSGTAEISCNRNDSQNLVEKYFQQFDNKTNVKYVTTSGEMIALNIDDIDHVLGLFSNNQMDYESVRDKGSDGQPSLTEMTKTAIKILDNKKNKNGFLLMVEGGRIDQAHHQNYARLAIEEMVEFERAIQEAVDMTSDDTLIIVTADHAHSMVFNGYPTRGSDIFGMGNKPDAEPYETLVYSTGPGYYMHVSNDTNRFINITQFSDSQRAAPTYMHSSLIPMPDGTHSGEDVGVFAIGPGSRLIQGVFEQNYIPYVISFASCVGPVSHKNPLCVDNESKSNLAADTNQNLSFLLTLNCICILFRQFVS